MWNVQLLLVLLFYEECCSPACLIFIIIVPPEEQIDLQTTTYLNKTSWDESRIGWGYQVGHSLLHDENLKIQQCTNTIWKRH